MTARPIAAGMGDERTWTRAHRRALDAIEADPDTIDVAIELEIERLARIPTDDPASAAVRVFSELPVLPCDPPLPADAGLRTTLLERDLANATAANRTLRDALRECVSHLERADGNEAASLARAARRALTLGSL